jgi:hypothetical protein
MRPICDLKQCDLYCSIALHHYTIPAEVHKCYASCITGFRTSRWHLCFLCFLAERNGPNGGASGNAHVVTYSSTSGSATYHSTAH